MKKIWIIAAFLLSFIAITSPEAYADVIDLTDPLGFFERIARGVETQSTQVENGVESLVILIGEGRGLDGILGIFDSALSFLKLIVAPIMVIFAVIMGVRMVSAGSENEEVLIKSKNFAMYAVQGLLVIFVADTLVEVTFGPGGDVFRGGDSGVNNQAREVALFLRGIYSLIQIVLGSVAVLVLVSAGFRYIAGSFSDDQIATAKRQITWSLVGLFVVLISEFVVKAVLFPQQGTTLGVNAAEQLFAQVTNFIAGTIGTLAFISCLYAGFLYVTARDNEDNVSKAKGILTAALIGIVIAMAAFAFTGTIVELDVGT